MASPKSVIVKRIANRKTGTNTQRRVIPEGHIYEQIPEGQDFKMRLIAYNPKTIQIVRNLDGFESYHMANPGTLSHILTQTTIISMFPESKLESIIRGGSSSTSNHPYGRPQIIVSNPGALVTGLKMPDWSEIIESSIRWIKGLIMRAHGAEGLNVIKEAQENALKHFSLKTE